MTTHRMFQRLIALVLLCCLLLSAIPAASAASKKSTNLTVSFTAQTYQNRARDALKQINKIRAEEGLPELIMTGDLEKAAIQRAGELFVFFDHFRPDMTDYDTIIDEYESLDPCEVSTECIAAGFSKAEETYLEWYSSSYDAITDPDFTHAGVGCVYMKGSENEYYWALLLTGFPEDYEGKAAGKATKAGASKSMKVEISKDMYTHADNSHKRFELRCVDVNLKSKSSATLTVNLYDRYDVKIGKCENADLKFRSSNTSLFTVSAEGEVKRKKSGSGTLTITAPGLEDLKVSVTCGSGSSSGSSSSGSTASNAVAVTATTIKEREPELTATEYSSYTKLSVYVKGASGYVLYRSTSKTGTYSKVDEQATTKRWDVKIQDDDISRTYYYKVRAYKNSNGKRVYSEYSDPVKVAP